MSDIEKVLRQQIETAVVDKSPLNIIGGDSKARYGRLPQGEALHVGGHNGIISYEPTELVMTVRAGTSLEEIEYTLNKHQQMLPFEPPHLGPSATIGGTIACNLSGPRRPYAGAARDLLLGVKMINGKAEMLRFGGEVMKNVAGYDVSRLMCGAMGTLGVLLEVSLKVLPRPASELNLVQQVDQATAIKRMNELSGLPLPLSASAWRNGRLYIRLSGTASAVQAARSRVGGERLDESENFWRSLREHQLPFFNTADPLWRLSLPPTTEPLDIDGPCLVEWGGGLRWIVTDSPSQEIFELAASLGGHATLFAGGDRSQQIFQPLDEGLSQLHRNLKQSFDPQGVFNPGRMYQDF